MRTLLNVLFLLFSGLIAYSQGFTLANPSAVAGGFGKYGDIPVSPYTGTTHLSIPIGSVSDGPLSHSISLGYHTGGNRVTDATGVIGLGWHLIGGGIISRTVQSVADDHGGQRGYITYAHELDPTDPEQQDQIADRLRDSAPDIFSYSIGPYSGKFYFNGEDIVQIPETDLKIEPVYYNNIVITLIKGFRIYAPDGTLYELGDENDNSTTFRESVEDLDNQGAQSLTHRSAWVLRKITSYDGQHSLSFEYTPFTETQTSTNHCITTLDGANGELETTCTDTNLEITTPHLKKIKGLNDSLTFHYVAANINGQTLNRLREAEYENTYICTKTVLVHDHFSDGTYYRNKLDQVHIQSCNGTEVLPPYKIDYYSVPGVSNENFFPKRNDRGIDHWGYYNAYSGNTSLIPPTTVPIVAGESYTYGSGYRESRFSSMLQGMLQKLTYPTGGHVTITYGPNIYQRPDNETGITRYLQVNNQNYPEENILIDSTLLADGKFFFYHLSAFGDCNQAGIVVTDVETGMEVDQYSPPGSNVDVDGLTFSDHFPDVEAGKTYNFSINTPGGGYPLCIVRFGIYDPESSFQFCGGLRVKTVTVHDGNDTENDIVKTYEYVEEDDQISSGNLFNIPVYGAPIGTPSFVYGAVFYASSVHSLTSFQGNHVGYSRVEEYLKDNGKIIHTFRKENDPTPPNPFAPPVFRGIDGIPDIQSVYDETNELKIESSNTIHPGDDYTFPDYPMVNQVRIHVDGGSLEVTATYPYQHRTCHTRFASQTVVKDGVSTTSEYGYDPANRFFAPVSTSMTDSEGKEHYIAYTRLIDYDYNGADYSAYIEVKNMILPIWKTEKFVDGIQTGGSFTEYDFIPNFFSLYPITQHRYEMTWDENGTPNGSWNKVLDIQDYENGIAKKTIKRGWIAENITLEDKKIKTKSILDHVTTYHYYNNSPLLQSTIAVDGTVTSYTYDDLGRLDTLTELCSGITKTYDRIYDTDPSDGIDHTFKTKTSYPFVHEDSQVTDLTNESHADGLGREIYSVLKNQSPNLEDLFLTKEYNSAGKVVKTYEMSTDPAGTSHTAYTYEKGGQKRILSTTPPEWYTTMMSYTANSSNEVYNYKSNTYYSAGSLYKSTTTDPDGNKIFTFTDKTGNKILDRRTSPDNNQSSDTYYLYDDKGRPIIILPPGTTPNDSDLIYEYRYDERDNIIYKKLPDAEYIEYRYNNRNMLAYTQDGNMRAVGQWYATQYDNLGRETKSGFFTGTPSTNVSFTQAIITEVLTENIYGTTPFEKDKIKTVKTKILNTPDWLSATYNYDACGRMKTTESNHHRDINNHQAITSTVVLDWMGNTLSNTTEYNINGIPTTIADRNTFDHAGRNIFSFVIVDNEAEQFLSGFSYTDKSEIEQKKLGGDNTIPFQKLDYTYNAQGMLRTINSPIDGESNDNPCGASSSSIFDEQNTDLFHLELKYDETVTSSPIYYNGNISNILWQVRGKQRKGYALEYDYLNRLKKASYGQFNLITFDETDFYSTTYSYDERGNIDSLTRNQQSIERNSADCYTKQIIDDLTYFYKPGTNKIDRVEDDAPCPGVLVLPRKINSDAVYAASEKVITQTTDVNCMANVDIYTGNKLEIKNELNISNNAGNCTGQIKIIKSPCPAALNFSEGFYQSSATGQYAYDSNGNLEHDPNKNINVCHNHLNLPDTITKQEDPVKELIMHYDARGNLLYRETRIAGQVVERRDYFGRIEYKDNVLESIVHTEGRITKNELLQWQYEFVIRDHLGNARLWFADKNNNGTIVISEDPEENEVLQESHYYPFGLEMKGFWRQSLPANHNNYTYNSIEHIDALGLNVNMATFRTLDPALGRWWQTDPKAEVLYEMSPYQSMGNNPISNADPEGDLFFLIPQISFKGGLNFGVELGIGIPGVLSASVTGGIGSNGGYWSVQGSAGGLYAGYGSGGGFAGLGYQYNGFSAGYDFGSGATSIGYGGGLGGRYGGSIGLSYGKGGLDWSANASASFSIEELKKPQSYIEPDLLAAIGEVVNDDSKIDLNKALNIEEIMCKICTEFGKYGANLEFFDIFEENYFHNKSGHGGDARWLLKLVNYEGSKYTVKIIDPRAGYSGNNITSVGFKGSLKKIDPGLQDHGGFFATGLGHRKSSQQLISISVQNPHINIHRYAKLRNLFRMISGK